MAFVTATPDMLSLAAADVADVGSALTAAHTAAASATTTVVAAAGDEVSAAVAALFGGYARGYQAVSAQAAAFHDRFVLAMRSAAGWYAGTEAANAAPLQSLEQDAFSPWQLLTGRPLVGNGTDAAAATGAAGGNAGWLAGNGGNGGLGCTRTAWRPRRQRGAVVRQRGQRWAGRRQRRPRRRSRRRGRRGRRGQRTRRARAARRPGR